MRRNEVFRGSFLKAEALKRPDGKYNTLTVTIKGKPEDHEFDDGKSQRVIAFHEDDRKLGLNQTNWDSIAEITGKDDDDHWDGHKIVLWVDPRVRFGNETRAAIRVRPVEGQQTTALADLPPTSASPNLTQKAMAWQQIKTRFGGDAGKAAPVFKAAFDAVGKGKPETQFTESDWAAVALYDPAAAEAELPPF